MIQRVVLAYSGSIASAAAVRWLRERGAADVVAVTVDLGQTDDLDEVRARALAAGAVRAHVIDAREAFARGYVIPALQSDTAPPLARLAEPLIARTLLDVAAIESTDTVAHAARTAGLDGQLAAAAPEVRVLTPAREWQMDDARLLAFARMRGAAALAARRDPHLLIRPAVHPSRAPEAPAHIELAFEQGLPAALNGVPMALQELLEILSLIAGQHGIGHGDEVCAPAAILLRAAYAAPGAPGGIIRMKLHKGTYALLPGAEPVAAVPAELVHQP